MNLGIKVGTLLFKNGDEWYTNPIQGLFDLDILFSDKFLLPFIEKKIKIKLIGISKYVIYFLDETRK